MSAPKQQGFVLAATIWIIAIVTLVIGYFADQVNNSLALAQQKRNSIEQQLSFANTRAEVLFRLTTTPMSFYGLGLDATSAIRLDSTLYRGSGADVVQLQDERGLININFLDTFLLGCFLKGYGISYVSQTHLIDTLQDYTDEDNLRRLNGAESADYEKQKLPIPPNDYLLTPYQLKNLIGWRSMESLWKEASVTKFLSASRVSGLNPNTAPVEVLSCLPGVGVEHAEKLIQLRKENPLYMVSQLSKVTGVGLDADAYLFFPSNSIRVTQTGEVATRMEQYVVTLTPMSDAAPWRVDYFFRSTVAYRPQNAEKIKNLPPHLGAIYAVD